MRIGVGLSIPELATRGGRFSPASLFTSGVAGAWYDPSDINNYMAGLGSELVTNGGPFTATTGWTALNSTLSVSSNALRVTENGVSGNPYAQQSFAVTSGAWYKITFDLVAINAQKIKVWVGSTYGAANWLNSADITYAGPVTLYFLAAGSTAYFEFVGYCTAGGTSEYYEVNYVSVKQVTNIANATLFQDSAGTTPVTAVEQPVGLMLDKSQGLSGSGSQLVTNGDFSSPSTTGWQASGGGSFSVVSNRLQVTGAGATGTGAAYTLTTIVGMTYTVSFDVVLGTKIVADSQMSLSVVAGASIGSSYQYSNVNGTYKYSFVATATTTYFQFHPRGTGNTASIDNFSVISLGVGNHASQATSASRPILRARYNLLTYSEQFDNAAWTKTGMLAFGSGSTVNATAAPDGTTTADLLTPDTSSSTKAIRLIVTGAGANTWSFYAKANGYTKVGIWDYATSGAYAAFLLSGAGSVLDSGSGASNATIASVGNGWYRCSFTATVTGSLGFSMQVLSPSYTTGSVNSAWTPNGTDGVYLWGAMLNTGSSAGTYQRIAAATDYATAGFLPYLALDGSDDSFGTNSIDFTATDKMSVCAGVTKSSDAASAMVAELSANAVLNAGAFNIQAPATGGNAEYRYGGGGTIFRNVLTSSYAAPITNVLAATQDIVGDAMNLRVNGVSVGTSALDQGTGNFGNYPLYIGRRNNASLPFNGRIYQLVVVGKTLSASELASTEAYVNTKTGAY